MLEIQGKYTSAKIFTDVIEDEALAQAYSMCNHPVFKDAQIRFMPDVHCGKNVNIGTTVKLTDYVNPSHVGCDIGCFTGNTKVKLTDGRSLSFLELIEEYNQGKENFCYSINDAGNVCITKINLPKLTKYVNKLCKIVLDNDKEILCTVDHKFMLRNGKYKEAQKLQVNESLMPLYIDFGFNVKDNIDNKKDYLEKYLTVYDPKIELYRYIHFLSDEYNECHNCLRIPIHAENENGFVRHHVDWNRCNNPNNVQRYGFKEHWKIHSENAKELVKLGIWGGNTSEEKHPGLHSRAGHIGMTNNWKNQDFVKRHNDRQINRCKNGDLYQWACSTENKKRMAEIGRNLFKNQDKELLNKKNQIKRIIKILIGLSNDNLIINKENWENNREKYVYHGLNYDNCLKFIAKYNLKLDIEFLQNEYSKIYSNHKVKSVEIINSPNTPVYCLVNQEFSNFGLDAGVFVHNCSISSVFYNKAITKDSYPLLEHRVRKVIPTGFDINAKRVFEMKEFLKFMNSQMSSARSSWPEMVENVNVDEKFITKMLQRIGMDEGVFYKSLGTLGSGNHFLELGLDPNGKPVWTIHCGSRNFGQKVFKYWDKVAKRPVSKNELKEGIENIKKNCKDKTQLQRLIKEYTEKEKSSKPNGYLYGEDMKGYLTDLFFCQAYAAWNHECIKKAIDKIMLEMFGATPDNRINSIHNYINPHDHIIRKGAITSYENELMIIPFNMRDGLAICKGKSNPDWNFSAPHGAGRIMSRSKAKLEVDIDEFKKSMEGIYSTSVGLGTLDESPMAYKNMEDIVNNIGDTCDILYFIKPEINIKAMDSVDD